MSKSPSAAMRNVLFIASGQEHRVRVSDGAVRATCNALVNRNLMWAGSDGDTYHLTISGLAASYGQTLTWNCTERPKQ